MQLYFFLLFKYQDWFTYIYEIIFLAHQWLAWVTEKLGLLEQHIASVRISMIQDTLLKYM